MAKVKQKLDIEKKLNEALVLKEEKTKDSLNEIEAKSKDSLPENLESILESDTISPRKLKHKPSIFGKDED
jgi:hypothetical protein